MLTRAALRVERAELTPETLDGALILPRGMLGTVTDLAARASGRLEITDELTLSRPAACGSNRPTRTASSRPTTATVTGTPATVTFFFSFTVVLLLGLRCRPDAPERSRAAGAGWCRARGCGPRSAGR